MAIQKACQNCKNEFSLDDADITFYEKIKVPPPTWCPACRLIRRMLFYNQRKLFRRRNEESGRNIFSSMPPTAPVKVYEPGFWRSDKWDPMSYGRSLDFSKPFFVQLLELFRTVPLPARSVVNLVNSDYTNYAFNLKNSYLCFDVSEVENSAYVVEANCVKESFDLFAARHAELCYENYMSDESYRVFFSVNCEASTDIWFSRNLYGCSNCFGCVNLRNKSYHIFNQQVSKERYQKFMEEFNSGSYEVLRELRGKVYDFWLKFPMRFVLAIGVENSTGEHIERSRNLKYCYSVHESERLGYSQFLEKVYDSYDYTNGSNSSRIYESHDCEDSCELKFCWDCWPECRELEYALFCRSSSNLFGCVGLQKKQYCILNKQYSREDYFSLREKVIKHMNDMPYIDKHGRVYKYGEFFPPEFSPFAYNETVAQDFFPLSREEAEGRGYFWREQEKGEYEITKKADELPDNIKDVDDSVCKEILCCSFCGGAYRIIPMELAFYRRIPLPLPRFCPECRFRERLKFVNSPKWRHARCQCAGNKSENGVYTNTNLPHPPHAPNEHCPVEFETSYASGRLEIIYCEKCYQTETA